ncbi:hypothetical protein D3C73_1350180 [compost metagenome]
MMRIRSKACKELSMVVISRKNVVGESNGKEILKNLRALLAPSRAAASITSRGRDCKPARYTTAQ